MSDASPERRQLVEIGRRLYDRGYVAAGQGNLSVRLADDRLLVTPSGVCKGFLKAEDLIVTDLSGRPEDPSAHPSSEIRMHCVAYAERSDIGAVVHAHPPAATAFAVAGIPLERATLVEVVVTLGGAPLAPYGSPATDELAERVRERIGSNDALLLTNHGAVSVGKNLDDAAFRMETLEQYARVSLMARLLGGENVLNAERVRELLSLREAFGITTPPPLGPGHPTSTEQHVKKEDAVPISKNDLEEIIEKTVRRVLKEQLNLTK